MLSATQQTQDEVERTKQQLSFEIDRIKQEADMKVGGLMIYLWKVCMSKILFNFVLLFIIVVVMSLQLEEQKFEMEKLRRELEEKMAEVTRIKGTLQSSEKVSVHLGC